MATRRGAPGRRRPNSIRRCSQVARGENIHRPISLNGARSSVGGGTDSCGIVTRDGVLHEVDVLVLATGFDAHAYMRPLDLVGEDGSLSATRGRTGPVRTARSPFLDSRISSC
jgi:hypothetical protein